MLLRLAIIKSLIFVAHRANAHVRYSFLFLSTSSTPCEDFRTVPRNAPEDYANGEQDAVNHQNAARAGSACKVFPVRAIHQAVTQKPRTHIKLIYKFKKLFRHFARNSNEGVFEEASQQCAARPSTNLGDFSSKGFRLCTRSFSTVLCLFSVRSQTLRPLTTPCQSFLSNGIKPLL